MDTRDNLMNSLLKFNSAKSEQLKTEFKKAYPNGKDSFDSDASRSHFSKLFFRNLRMSLVNQMDLSISGTTTFYNQDTKALLNFLFWAASNGLVENADAFPLMEDIYDCLPISEIFVFFEFLEELVKVQKKPLGQKQYQSLIRIGNGIMKKLSKVHDNVFRGRVQLLLATIDSLSGQIVQQKKSILNASNVLSYETSIHDKKSFVKNLEPESRVSFALYQRFWELQKFLHNPGLLFTADNSILLENEDYEEVEGGDPEIAEIPKGVATKKKITVESKVEAFSATVQRIMNIFKSDPTSDYSEVPYIQRYPKYSTKSSLLNIQLRDPGFRKTVIAQVLISIWCLKNPITIDNQKVYELKEKELEKINSLEKNVVELAKSMRDEKEKLTFYDKVSPFLEHEKFWSVWKEKGCTSLEKIASEELRQKLQNAQNHSEIVEEILQLEKKPGNPRQFPDFKTQDKLFSQITSIASKSIKDTGFDMDNDLFAHLLPVTLPSLMKPVEPSVSYYFDMFLNEAKDPDMREEDKVASNENIVWKAYRVLARNWIKLFTDAIPKKDSDYELKLSDIVKKIQGKAEGADKTEDGEKKEDKDGNKTPQQPTQPGQQADSAVKVEVKEEPKEEAVPKQDMIPEEKPSEAIKPEVTPKNEGKVNREMIEEKLKAKRQEVEKKPDESKQAEEGEIPEDVNAKRSANQDITEFENESKKVKS